MKVKFKEWNCIVKFLKYNQNKDRIAISLIDAKDFSPVCKVTLNLPEIKLAENEVIIKNYSENAGVYECLVEAGILSSTYRIVNTKFVQAIICKLLKTE